MNSRRRCRARRQRGHLSFKLVLRAKLVPYSVSLRLVFVHCGAWANDHCAPSIYGIWHHFYRYTTGLRHSEAISGRKDYFCGDTIASKLLA